MPTKGWHLPSTSTRIKSWAVPAADLQYPVKGIQYRDQALCALGKTGRIGLQIESFKRFYEPSSHVSYLESAKIFHGDVCSSRPAVTFCKSMCLVACPPPSQKSRLHWLSPLPVQSAFSKLCEAVVLILPQIKLNSQLSHCGFVCLVFFPVNSSYSQKAAKPDFE